MDFTLKGTLKKYNRMRGWRLFFVNVALCSGFVAPWLFELTRTETMICALGALTISLLGHLEMRLKTIQIRLAGMADEIGALQGKELEDNLITELNDW